MGLAWCRERVEHAENSKSPVDRILVRCHNLMKPRSNRNLNLRSEEKNFNDFAGKTSRSKDTKSSYTPPVHVVSPGARQRPGQKTTGKWKQANFVVGSDYLNVPKPPIPPPRKKKKRKMNSTEVLNIEFPELCSPAYVKQSENLRNRNAFHAKGTETGKETDVSHPRVISYWEEGKTSGQDRFEKLLRKRIRKIRTESYPKAETAEKSIKNDGEKRKESKIKHLSTVSLPNYNELIKRNRKVSADMMGNGDDKNENQSAGLRLPPRNSSTISLPGEGSNSMLGSLSEATIHCLENYMKRCRSFGSLKQSQPSKKLEEFNNIRRTSSESSDSWCGLDEWDLAVIEYCDPQTNVLPSSRPKATSANKREKLAIFQIGDRQIRKTNDESKLNSFEERRPLERFLDSEIPRPSPRGSADQENSGSKPSSGLSAERSDEDPKEEKSSPLKDSKEHSSLFQILTRCEKDEREPEMWTDVGELANVAGDDSQKYSMNFDEANAELSSKRNFGPIPAMKNRSSSLEEEKFRRSSLTEEMPASRSPSNSFGCSTHLLRQLQNNKEAIEREILQRPNELLERLRRESLFRSVPKDAFEAFEKKKMTSLRRSLNEFLGFKNPKENPERNDDYAIEGSYTPNANLENAAGCTIEETESSLSRETPPMGTQIEIVINETQRKKEPVCSQVL